MNSDRLLCWKCRKTVPYTIYHRERIRTIGNKDYRYQERFGKCDICGEEITVPGLADANESILDSIYRIDNELITVDEINELLQKYNIEKRPLSHVLGMGEHTITRYLEGAVPNRKYSEFLKRMLTYHVEMRKKLEENKARITEAAYKKTDEAISVLEGFSSHESKTELIALYILHMGYEITNLSLQKLLYYVKGFSYLMLGKDIIEEECEAWAYGPVIPYIYEKYKKLGNSVIPDYDVSIEYGRLLSSKEIAVLDHTVNCLGIFNGKVLMELTHKEKPWVEARAGIPAFAPSKNTIKEKTIFEYFEETDRKFNLKTQDGVKLYVQQSGVI